MRTLFIALIATAGVLAAGAVSAAGAPTQTPEQEQSEDGHFFDAGFGDRYESDKDLNEGNEISDQELEDLIRALNGPGV